MTRGFDKGNFLQIGGQAVIEGVTMRAPGMLATAVRRKSGEILVKKESFVSIGERIRFFRMPVFRGAAGLIEMMVIGVRTLNYSAEIAFEDTDKAESGREKGQTEKPSKVQDVAKLGLTVIVSLLLGVGIFFAAPIVATTFLLDIDQQPLAFNLTAGVMRIALLLAYLGLISLSKNIRRLFQYHGAEHKAVFAYERGGVLTTFEAGRQSRFHPRCGTSFLLVVMCSAIFLFSLLDAWLIRMLGSLDMATRLATHLPLIPLVGGISYEFIKASASRSGSWLWRVVIAPGLWLQRITTKEPDNSHLEVAIVALRCALGEDEQVVLSTIHPQEIALVSP